MIDIYLRMILIYQYRKMLLKYAKIIVTISIPMVYKRLQNGSKCRFGHFAKMVIIIVGTYGYYVWRGVITTV